MIAALAPGTAFAANPHVPALPEGDTCPQCHAPHQAAVGENILRGGEGVENPVTFCYGCHDTGTINVKTGMNNAAFDGVSGHSVEAADTGGDLTNVCADCHDPHADSTTEFRLPKEMINGKDVGGADNTWCFACHDDAQSWWTSVVSGRTTAQYTALIPAPSRNATGYPTTGTFPGSSVYNTPLKNAHANIPAGSMDDWVMTSREATRVAGDCLWCHSGHRGKSEYDGLVDTFGAPKDPVGTADLVDGDYTAVCLRCHAETLAAGITFDTTIEIPNVADSVLADTAAPESFNGHRVRSSGGDLPVNSPLPCYMCHNPHGSTRNNSTLFSDTLGANLDTSTDAGMRAFCFTCHTTYDETGGLPYGWDSVANAYAPVGATVKVAGLLRAADETTKANKLRLWQIARPGHSKDDPQNCITCHLDVHAPMGNVSMGNMECLECHQQMQAMVPGSPGSTDSYHHVLNADNPDAVPGEDPYCVFPTDPENQPWALRCVSCHVDHNKYESKVGASDPDKADGKAFNLRHSAMSPDPVASNTDEGLCLSCHSYTLSSRIYRSTDDAYPDPGLTPVPEGQANNALYATAVMRVEDDMWGYEPDPTDPLVNLVPESERSPHNYTADGVFDDGSAFKANCAKCHGTLDDATLSYSEPAFTVHFSAEQRLLNALGQDRSNLTPPQTAAINEEDMCFRCHSNSTDKLGASTHDYYGGRFMGVASRVIGTQMSGNPFGHKPASYDKVHRISSIDEPQEYLGTVVGGVAVNKHVECADCHNHHVVGDSRHVYGTDNRVSDAIKGVRGVGFKTTSTVLQKLAASNWPTTPDPIDYGSDTSELEYKQMATYEYEICFKCHSSANADVSGNVALPAWGGPMVWTVWPGQTEGKNVSVNNWTNVAQDFNVGNNSRHPVLATLSGYYYPTAEATSMELWPGYPPTDTSAGRTSSLDPGQLSNGWGPNDTMMCSDCHGHSSAPPAMVQDPPGSGNWVPNPAAESVPQGPHGSSIRFSLRGPGTDWPVKKSTGAPIVLADLADSTYAPSIFCANCHPAAAIRDNRAHSAGGVNHPPLACVSCHVVVPHGSKMSRLLGDHETMDPRFAYQGNKNNVLISSFKKTTGAYAATNCSVVDGSACDKGQHRSVTGNQTDPGWENW